MKKMIVTHQASIYSLTNMLVFFILLLTASCLLPAKIKDSGNQADYIIIYPSFFEPELIKFKDWRQSGDMSVVMINIDSIYKEFPSNSNAQSIHDFFTYACSDWNKPLPRFALLVGGINQIPSVKIKNEINISGVDSISIDEYLVSDTSAKKLPLLALGRFPARNADELKRIILKTMKFENEYNKIGYKKGITFLTDSVDAAIFESYAENIISANSLEGSINRLYLDTASQYYGDRETLKKYMSDGSVFLCNFVHGNPKTWSFKNIVSMHDMDTLILSSKPYIITALSCNQNFDDTLSENLIERMLLKDTNDAVAAFCSSGENFSAASFNLFREIYKNIYGFSEITIGEAILKSKKIAYEYNNYRFTLLGDPALRIPTDLLKKLDCPLPVASEIFQLYPNPAAERINIIFKSEDFNKITINIYDTFGNEIPSDNLNSSIVNKNGTILDLTNFSSGLYLLKLNVGTKTYSQKFVVCR
jgi:hypothetical protein